MKDRLTYEEASILTIEKELGNIHNEQEAKIYFKRIREERKQKIIQRNKAKNQEMKEFLKNEVGKWVDSKHLWLVLYLGLW